jgi:hypothetical protein
MKHIYLVILFLILNFSVLAQGVQLEVSASAEEVAMGDYFQVTYSLKNAEGANFQLPRVNDFHVQGPSKGFRQYNFNGKISSEQNFIYTLVPKSVGTFKIPAASISWNGKTLKSNALTIKVVPQKKQTPTQNLNTDLGVALVAELSKTNVYVGERVYLDFWIYTRHNIESYKIENSPTFKGIFTEDVENLGNNISNKKLNGVLYTTKLVRRMVLSPQQEGNIKIDPMTMRIAVDKGVFNYQVETIVSNTLKLNIQPLPTPQPADFSGTVGSYELVASINQNRLTTDETFKLNVQISGKGDVKRIAAPNVNLAEDKFDVYDPRISESFVEKNSEKIYTKTFEYLIAPKEAGEFLFAPSFTYFDPNARSYKTVAEDEIVLTVLKGTGVVTEKTEEKKLDGDIRFINLDGRLHSKSSFYSSIAFWLLLLLPLLALGGVIFYKQRLIKDASIDPITRKRMKANSVANQRLAQAKTYLDTNNSRQFYDEISKALLGFISDKLNIPNGELSKNNVQAQLENQNIDAQHIQRVMKVLNNCEMALFAGLDNSENMHQTYQEVKEILNGM